MTRLHQFVSSPRRILFLKINIYIGVAQADTIPDLTGMYVRGSRSLLR
jgi:hypothetical protein